MNERPDPSNDSQRRDDDPRKTPPPPPPMRLNRGMFGWFLLIALAIMLFVFLSSQNQATERSAYQLISYAKNGQVEKVVFKGSRVEAKLKDSEDVADRPANGMIYVIASSEPMQQRITDELWKIDPKLVKVEEESMLVPILISLLPWLLIFGLIWFFVFRAMRGGGGGMGMLGQFGRSRHKLVNKEITNVTLSDVAGIEESKEEVGEIIEFLKNPKKFQRLGGRIPRGVLLIGEPGCGKTLLAKAVAGEAEVPFFSISGSDFVEMFVGVGASRVRDLFKQAKDSAPCIIFLDEIDAVGRRRGTGFTSGGHDEREQTLNAILVEMDGFDTSDQVIVIAATNRADVLDPALTRPGRFDRTIQVPLPDLKGRLEILRVHAKKIKLSPMVNMERVARGTPMFSGADLAAIINEAAILATLGNKDFVEQEDLEEARDKVRFGRAYKSRKLEEEEREGTAYHEAGHAVIQKLMEHADPLHKVTIIPRGRSLGATFSLPEKDRYGVGLNYLRDSMRVLCGGRIAEMKKTGDATSGAAMDIHMVTGYARHMVLEWGMSDRLGFVDYTPHEQPGALMPEKSYSEQTARLIDEEVKRLIDEAYRDAEKLVNEHWDTVEAMAQALLKYETLSADEVDQIMKGKSLDKPTVSDLLDAEAERDAKSKPASPAPPTDLAKGDDGILPSPA